MQGDAAFPIPLGSRNFRPPQSSRTLDLDPLRPHPHRPGDALFHGPAESHPPLQLQGDILAHKLRIQIRSAHLNDIEIGLPIREPGELLLELLNLGALLTDHNSRTGGMDVDLCLVSGPFNFNL
jgi:hypothetical protein